MLTKKNMKGVLELHDQYEAKGLTVLAFLSNMSNQENRTPEESFKIIRDKYKAERLSWFQRVEVNGPNAHPLFKYLRMNSSLHDPAKNETLTVPWVHSKFLVDAEGKVIQFIRAQDMPSTAEPDLIKLLAD